MKQSHIDTLNELSNEIHENNVAAGWWTDLKFDDKVQALVQNYGFNKATAEDLLASLGMERSTLKTRNKGELLALCHSELSEALEGVRKNLQDEKLPHRSAFEVELADVFIRLFDIAGAYKLDLGGAIAEKRAYNAKRADHKIENRLQENGKKF